MGYLSWLYFNEYIDQYYNLFRSQTIFYDLTGEFVFMDPLTQHSHFPKAKEAEDLIKKPVRIFRSTSDYRLYRLNDENDLAKKCGQVWDCISSRPDIFGGRIYTFKLKKEYDDLTHRNIEIRKTIFQRLKAAIRKRDEIYPAPEPLGAHIVYLDPKIKMKHFIDRVVNNVMEYTFPQLKLLIIWSEQTEKTKNHIKSIHYQLRSNIHFLNQLGYKSSIESDGVYLNLPDLQALQIRWRRLQLDRPSLSDLSILSVDGEVSDWQFVEAFFSHDAILSTNSFFMHDSYVHALTVILLMLTTGKQKKHLCFRKEMAQNIAIGYKTLYFATKAIEYKIVGITEEMKSCYLEHKELLEKALGSRADYYLAQADYENYGKIDSDLDNYFSTFCNDQALKRSLYQQFSEEKIKNADLRSAWKAAKVLAKTYLKNCL